MKRKELIAELRGMYPNMFLKTSEEFGDYEGGIWTTSSERDTQGELPLFDYDSTSQSYDMGVHNFLFKFLESRGWYVEFYDPETILIFPD